jgi:hypothetical protein
VREFVQVLSDRANPRPAHSATTEDSRLLHGIEWRRKTAEPATNLPAQR